MRCKHSVATQAQRQHVEDNDSEENKVSKDSNTPRRDQGDALRACDLERHTTESSAQQLKCNCGAVVDDFKIAPTARKHADEHTHTSNSSR